MNTVLTRTLTTYGVLVTPDHKEWELYATLSTGQGGLAFGGVQLTQCDGGLATTKINATNSEIGVAVVAAVRDLLLAEYWFEDEADAVAAEVEAGLIEGLEAIGIPKDGLQDLGFSPVS